MERGRRRRRRSTTKRKSQSRQRSIGWPRLKIGPLVSRVLAGVALVIFVGAIVVLLSSPTFAVQEISVTGSQRLGEAKVINLAGLKGRNMFTIDTEGVRQSLKQATPFIKDAFLDFHLPAAVAIKVEERAAVYAWQSGGITYRVSADGVVLEAGETTGTLVAVQDPDSRPLMPGDQVNTAVLETALKLRQTLPSKAGVEPRAFTYSPDDGIAVTTADGMSIVFGGSEDWSSKLATLQTVLSEAKSKNMPLQLIDLRFKNRPYFR